MDETPRSGWTWLNVAAVAACVCFALLLALPQISRTRDAARRTQCKENLKQLGLALHNYNDNHKVLPPGIVATDDPSRPGDLAFAQFIAEGAVCDSPAYAKASGFTMLLPYFEEKLAYDQYNKRLACCAIQNATSVATRIGVLMCPAAPHDGQPFANPYYAGKTVGRTDYAFSIGGVGVPTSKQYFNLRTICGEFEWMAPRQFLPSAGAFHVNSSVHFGLIKDGLTNTILMGECAGGAPAALDASGVPVAANGSLKDAKPGPEAAAAWSQGYIPGPRGRGGYGSVFAASAWNAWYGYGFAKSEMLADRDRWIGLQEFDQFPQAARPTWASSPAVDFRYGEPRDGTAAPPTLGSMAGFRSGHPRIAYCVWGDGSVRVVGQNTSAQALVAYTSIRGREWEWMDQDCCE